MKELTDIAQIQTALFQLLVYFDDFCRANNLRYFLSNGTLLGAVKYGNFIPWDDDADVFMPRADYNRLLELGQPRDSRYRLLCLEQEKDWRLPFAKLTDSSTRLVEAGADFGLPIGISLDIFPIDPWGKTRAAANCRAIYGNLLKRMICDVNAERFYSPKTGVQRLILRGIWACGHLVGHRRLIRRTFGLANRIKHKSAWSGCVVWAAYGTREVIPSEVFDTAIPMTFCGRQFPAPVGYETYLRSLYGNYRAELPAEKQKSNHRITAWSLHE